MSLSSEYKKQFEWRNWNKILNSCPIEPGQKVLDLGCGHGDLAYCMAERGALVTGVDANAELLDEARANSHKNCTFVALNLSNLNFRLNEYDGIWCSFTAAYFTNFQNVLAHWLSFLKPKGWICITEVDHLLGHDPISVAAHNQIQEYYKNALVNKRYDFEMGRKLEGILQETGCLLTKTIISEDQELSFSGPAGQPIVNAWNHRFARMPGLQKFLGTSFANFQSEFISAIKSNNHKSLCRVISVLGEKPLQ